ncbi:unnamed protein product [Arabis nemorensis]|uniref:Uncharacterized protein n=1 Tax=Arabis nemorensis TaxID=586526 RepID=A0A565C7W7_9BRAS|nr:unnamed protein product [Arabis nemorensis]
MDGFRILDEEIGSTPFQHIANLAWRNIQQWVDMVLCDHGYMHCVSDDVLPDFRYSASLANHAILLDPSHLPRGFLHHNSSLRYSNILPRDNAIKSD